MTDKLQLPQRALDIYRCLKGAAEHGDECPTNNVLAVVGGYSKASSVCDVVSMLEELGLITVTRYSRARVVTILETGKSTKAVEGRAVRYLDGRRRAAA